jgi:dTDP-glucose 4,6-dehydratase
MSITHRPTVILVTGAAGFIGVHFVRHLLAGDADVRVVSYDALTYAGCLESLQETTAPWADRHHFIQARVQDRDTLDAVLAEHNVDTIVHLAAESHVDRSICASSAFLETNIIGTHVLLEAAVAAWRGRSDVRFHHVSTDEVFGSLETGAFTEETPYNPSSPYSASKASSDHLVRAWGRTYGLPVTLSNCSNNYGPYQFPEKLLPLMIDKALHGKAMPVYGDGLHVRDWLYVEDHCRALDTILRRGRDGRTYNVGGRSEWKNIDAVRLVCRILDELHPRSDGTPHEESITFVEDRPGHDRRYAIDSTRIERELGWKPSVTFPSGLRQTIQWYLDRQGWVARLRLRYSGQRLGLSVPQQGGKNAVIL